MDQFDDKEQQNLFEMLISSMDEDRNSEEPEFDATWFCSNWQLPWQTVRANLKEDIQWMLEDKTKNA